MSFNRNIFMFQFSCAACGQMSTKTMLFQNIVPERWYSPGLTVSSLHCLMNPPIIYSSMSINFMFTCSVVTLLVATGCKQVCPPAVKLQKTLNASEVQPKFGSIQNQPERIQSWDMIKRKTNILNLHKMWHSKPPTIIELMTTVQQIFTDTSRVFLRPQRLFDSFDDGA